MRRTFRYRLYPTAAQADVLERQLAVCCELYNAALQERRACFRATGKSISFAAQSRQLPGIKADCPDVGKVFSQVLQDVLHRVDRAFNGFFRRVRAGQKAGYPRFRSRLRYDSLTYPQAGFGLEDRHVIVSKIGRLKIKLHRPVQGTIKTLSLKRQAGRWYALFCCEVHPAPLPVSDEAVGIDVGLTTFAVLSDGSEIANPNYARKAKARLRVAQRRVARRKKGSTGRRKAVRMLQRAHARVQFQRSDFHHKAARTLVDRFGLIALEDLNIKGLAGGMLARSVNDAGWGMFLARIDDKAVCAGRLVVRVNPNGTTQRCSGCQTVVPKTLNQRWHDCPQCGLSLSRDENAAREILRLGLSLAGVTWPLGRACRQKPLASAMGSSHGDESKRDIRTEGSDRSDTIPPSRPVAHPWGQTVGARGHESRFSDIGG
jgi:putative transposase